jgi:hypothetical protein
MDAYSGRVASAPSVSTDDVDLILADQSRMESLRSFYESTWRDIDRYIDPFGAGGFDKGRNPTFNEGVEDLYDITAIDGLDRYTAAIGGLTIPRQQRWHGVGFDDEDLMKIPAVKRYCQAVADRLFRARYTPTAGFEVQANEDIRQEGKYGSSPLWVGDRVGAGLFYKTLHLSEVYFDEDYCGQVTRVHRLYMTTLRKAADEFGLENLSDKAQRDFEDPKKRDGEIEILHAVRPNNKYEPGYLGVKGMKVESITIETAEKHVVKHKGFRSMPILVSRHITGPRDVYGRSPAMKALATTKGLNAMAYTILDGGNRAVDPPLLFASDSDITKVVTRPGGLTPGGVDDQGRPLVHPLYTGAQLPFGMEIQNNDRDVVKRVFLEELFLLLSNPSDRMTATQVLEQLKKEGVLVAPFAGRRENEKLGPQIAREIEILGTYRALPEPPPEVIEAGLKLKPVMTNPLSRMARAEEVSGFTRTAELAIQAASAGAEEALDIINWEEGIRDTADVLGARPTHINTPEEIAAKREARQARQDAAQATQAAPDVADAALSVARANQISQQLGGGGGLG